LFLSLHDPSTTLFYTLSLHDALPIFDDAVELFLVCNEDRRTQPLSPDAIRDLHAFRQIISRQMVHVRAWLLVPVIEPFVSPCVKIGKHTSELQSLAYLVCRLLLEKKK